MDIITEKALRLLQNMFSFDEINKRILPLDEEFKPEDDYDYFKIKDYFGHVNDNNIQILIELSVFMRRKAEEERKFKASSNALVKYSNIGQYLNKNECIDFEEALSKIIHADNIQFEFESKNGLKTYGYSSDRNSKYTGLVLIDGKKKDGNYYQAKIDVIKFCINVFVYTADRYTMI